MKLSTGRVLVRCSFRPVTARGRRRSWISASLTRLPNSVEKVHQSRMKLIRIRRARSTNGWCSELLMEKCLRRKVRFSAAKR